MLKVLFIGLLMILLGGISSWFYYRQVFYWLRNSIVFSMWILMTLNFFLNRNLSDIFPLSVIRITSWVGGYWLAFIYYSVLYMVLHGLIYGIFYFWPTTRSFLQIYNSAIIKLGLVSIVLFIAWGGYKALDPVIRYESIFTNKQLMKPLRIVLVSDIHLGRVLGRSYCMELVEKINQENPDLVLLAGDIIDDELAIVTKEKSMEPFKDIQAPQGVYGIYGNHDYLDENFEELKLILSDYDVKLLADEKILLPSGIQLVGLSDYSKIQDIKALQSLATDNELYYSILLDHQPRRIRMAEKEGYDLYLGGHTHTGQLFPNHLLTKQMYLLDYGKQEYGSLTAIVSNGYGFWGTPVRTELRPEIVVIDIKKSEN